MLNNGPRQLVELWFNNLNGKCLELFLQSPIHAEDITQTHSTK